MSTQIEQLNKRKDELQARQEAILNSATESKRALTAAENEEFGKHEAEVKDIVTNVARYQALSKDRSAARKATSTPIVGDSKDATAAMLAQLTGKKSLSPEYFEAFYKNAGKWRILNDMNFEDQSGSDVATGGVIAPTIYEGQVVALAPQNLALRQLAFVTPTQNDIKIPRQVSRAVAAKKTQSTDNTSTTGTSFAATNPTIELITLGADMLGNYVPCSLEALQDIGYMQAFVQNDLSYAVLQAEEVAYTDVLLDNTDGAELFSGSLSTPEDYLDMTVQPDKYDANSSWLMPKRTSISLRKAQVASNQFNPFWTVVNGREYFHGYPVYHSTKLEGVGSPAADAVVFGDFKQGLIIGDRNNSAVLVKVDDITQFKAGIIQIFAYRRSQALVRDQKAVRTSVQL